MTGMFGEAWPPMSVPDLAPDDDDDDRFGTSKSLPFGLAEITVLKTLLGTIPWKEIVTFA